MSDEERERRRAYFTAYRRVWRAEHREQDLANGRKQAQKSYRQDPVKHRQRAAAARYGITVPEYLAFISQGICDACGKPSDKTLEIDHDHDTGSIRGVLCHNCNSALGHVRDDESRLLGLVAYLGRVRVV
jgi:hypothetical protein